MKKLTLNYHLIGLIAMILLPVFLVIGCATDTANEATNRRHRVENAIGKEGLRLLGSVAFNTLTSVAQTELSGGNADWGHTAAQEVWKAAPGALNSASIERIINAATEGNIPVTAKAAAQQFGKAVSSGVPPAKAQQGVADAISHSALTISGDRLFINGVETQP